MFTVTLTDYTQTAFTEHARQLVMASWNRKKCQITK